MLMNYLLCISYSFMSLINMETTQTLFRNSVYKIIYFSIIIVLSLILEYYWFEKDEKKKNIIGNLPQSLTENILNGN